MALEERIVASGSHCLVDALVLAAGVRNGFLERWCGERRIAVGELTCKAMREWYAAHGSPTAIDVGALVADGRIAVIGATARELADVVRWVGDRRLSRAELEMVAIVLAGRARICTMDGMVRRVMRELGIDDRCVGVEELVS